MLITTRPRKRTIIGSVIAFMLALGVVVLVASHMMPTDAAAVSEGGSSGFVPGSSDWGVFNASTFVQSYLFEDNSDSPNLKWGNDSIDYWWEKLKVAGQNHSKGKYDVNPETSGNYGGKTYEQFFREVAADALQRTTRRGQAQGAVKSRIVGIGWVQADAPSMGVWYAPAANREYDQIFFDGAPKPGGGLKGAMWDADSVGNGFDNRRNFFEGHWRSDIASINNGKAILMILAVNDIESQVSGYASIEKRPSV